MKSRIGILIDESPYKNEYIRKYMDVSRNTLSNWRSGKTYPTIDKAFKLADLLGVKVDDLYETKGNEE